MCVACNDIHEVETRLLYVSNHMFAHAVHTAVPLASKRAGHADHPSGPAIYAGIHIFPYACRIQESLSIDSTSCAHTDSVRTACAHVGRASAKPREISAVFPARCWIVSDM